MKVQFIQVPEGSDLAILPVDDYKAMVQRLEYLEEYLAADKTNISIEAGEETFPDELVQ